MTVRKREYKNKENKQIWEFDFWLHGKRYRSAGFVSKAEAQIAEAKERERVIAGKIPDHSCTFEEVIRPFLNHRQNRIAASTYRNDKNRITGLVSYFGRKHLFEISPSDIQSYMDIRLKNELAARTVNLEINLLSAIFQFAINQGIINDNPARKVKRLRVIQREPWLPDNKQFTDLVEAAKKTEVGLELAVWIIFRGYTGTRPTESFYMEWKDVDFEKGMIFIRPKNGNPLKNSRFRVVPLHNDLKEALLEWRGKWVKSFEGKNPPHDWIFFNPRHPDLRCQRFEKSFPRAIKEAGMTEGMTSHCLRHYFISKAVECGVNHLVLAKWVGHAGTRMIEQVYAHLSPEFKNGEMEKIQISGDTVSK